MSRQPSVLLVDDHPENLLALEAVLEPLGIECVSASSGFEALRQVLRYDFAVILMDVQMPDMDGLETAAIIKRRTRSRDVPIIFVTGHESKASTMARGFAVGAVDYVIKPFDPELLRSKVRALVDLHRKDAQLRESEERFRAAFEHAPIGIALLAPDGTWLDANRALAEMVGRTTEEVMDAPPFDLKRLLAAEDGDRLAELLAGSRRSIEVERRLFTAAASTIWAAIKVSAVCNRHGEPVHLICQVQDVTERKRAEESLTARIAFLAYHDELTGLPNRAMLREHLDLALARAQRNGTAVAVLNLDLNRFKLVNDSLGHAAGDEVLRQAAARLAGAVRASDLVARVGGDEFIVLLADLDPGEPREVAELVGSGIHEALSKPFAVSEAEFYVGTSVGVALYPDGSRRSEEPDAEALLANADAAMYEAKQSGAPTVVHTRAAGRPVDRLELMTRLRRSAEDDDFVLHWMPIVDLDTARVCGVEALMRWRDPERGWVMPHDFMALAEESGLIDRVGLWALGEAAERQAEWHRAGLDLDVAVNVSSRQLWRPRAVAEMLERVNAAGADPERIVIELTESSTPRAADEVEHALAGLRGAGMKIAIDDFAHAPLAALARMELDVLKIDGTLVAASASRGGATLIGAIVQLARNLGIWPLAESIETRRQYDVMRSVGCRFGQGHFFARPMPAEDVPDFVAGFRLPKGFDPWVAWEASRASRSAVDQTAPDLIERIGLK